MIKMSLVILAGLLLAAALRQRSAALRHWILAAAIACGAVSPVLELVLPRWDLRPAASRMLPVARAPGVATTATVDLPAAILPPAATAPAPPLFGLAARAWRLTLLFWLLASGVSLMLLGVGLARLRWIARGARPVEAGLWRDLADELCGSYGITRRVVILQSRHPTLLVTWGFFRPRIALPAPASEWSAERARIVLAHELAHVRRGDWLAQMLAEVARAIYCVNPLMWIAAARLRQESEQACDNEVLALGVSGADYAGHLVELARAVRDHRATVLDRFPAPAMARQCRLERRVSAMLNARTNRRPATARSRAAATVVLLALTLLIGGFGARAQSFVSLSGSVLDPNRQGVPRAALTLTNAASQARHEVRSNDRGRFEFVGLPPGTYQLEAQLPGFRALRQEVQIAGRNVTRELTLALGSLRETISIVAAPGEAARGPEPRPRATAPATVKECQPAATGGNIRPPTKIRDVRPVYPNNPDGSIAGDVVLEGQIGKDGMISQVKTVRSSHPELERAAVVAFEQWEFTPTLLNCVPVDVVISATMTFSTKK